jgi:coenzyme F420 hydrogenase subunit beta
MIRANSLLCCQCGTCAGICPSHAIEMRKDTNGNYIPVIINSLCNGCNICEIVCPGRAVDFKKLNQEIFSHPPKNTLIGDYNGIYTGFSNDPEVLQRASSGGLVSSILIYALENKIINGAVVTRLSKEEPLKPEVFIARTKEEVLSAAQSKYVPVPVNNIIDQLLREEGNFAIVGLPCHIQGIRKAEQLNAKLKTKMVLHLGLICGHTDNLQATHLHMEKTNVSLKCLDKIEYRGGNWPGEVTLSLKDGTIMSEKYKNSTFKHLHTCGFFMPSHCTVCSDAMNELADISFGDAWLPEYQDTGHGMSVVISRSADGERILKECMQKGAITIAGTDLDSLISSQLAQISFKKKTIVARINALRWLHKEVPEINTYFLKPTIIDYIGVPYLYLGRYLALTKQMKQLLICSPSDLLSMISALTKFFTCMPPLRLLFQLRRREGKKRK